MADRFYVNCALVPGPMTLEGPEAHHLATVCRLRPGDAVFLFNGDGRQYPAQIETVGRREVTLRIGSPEAPEREIGFRLDVAAPLPKGDRAQFLVEKLTEVGVTTYVPLQTARSVVHPREAKLDKLLRYVIEASKQCGRNVLMNVSPMIAWTDYCRRVDLPERKVLAHPEEKEDEARSLERMDVALAVGPEGGFTEEEVEMAKAAGWRTVSLGPRILRVETAALVLAAFYG
jgi:16S rRNA (uracil1498-N3)-methyltransferase